MVSGAPELSPEDLDVLMGIALREEETDESWPGYDLERAASEGWGWKAGRLAEQRAVGAEGASLQNQQQFDHAIAMRDHYLSRAGSSGGIRQGRFRRTDVIR